MRLVAATFLPFVLFVGCEAPPEPLPHAARPVVELERWRVLDGDRAIGLVKKLQIQDPKGPIVFYRVEDASGHWLGHATEQGRFSRRVPFQDDEQDLGVWSLQRGTAELLEAATVRLVPVAIEADARRR
jgi:hypothetical protein